MSESKHRTNSSYGGIGARRRCADRRRRRGNIATIAAITIVPIIGAIGLGVDYTRISLVRSELQRGTDAGALGAARIINADGSNRDEIIDDALMYFWANYRRSVADAVVVGANPTVTIVEPNRDTVQVVANAIVPLVFGQFLGMSEARTHAVSSAQRAAGGMEVVLVLDNTGSMERGSRMSDLKNGAKDLIEILYGSSDAPDTKELKHCANGANCTTEYTLTVGTVPFITTVNVSPGRSNGGNGKGAIVEPAAVSRVDWGRQNGWKGCVMARPYPFEESKADATPSESPFLPYIWQPTNSRGANSWSRNDTKESWPSDAAPNGESADNRAKVGAGNGRGEGPNQGCGQPIMPLQPSRAAALAQIEGLEVGASNGTAVPIGLAWGWRLLSPGWRSYWADATTTIFPGKKRVVATTPAGVPRDYDTRNYEKVIVLFSDGENSIGASRSADDCCTSGYGDPATVRATLGADPVPEVNRRTTEICTAIKAKGIKIYVVLLYPNPPNSLLNLYNEKGCASGKNFFFLASSESQLQSIFRTVGSQLKNLRLVQ